MATVTGTNRSDVLNFEDGVTEAQDFLFGKQGKDDLFGLGGDDFLYGNQGKDELFGGLGNDTLDGGQGKDELTGGDGADTFMFTKGSGKDTITDFNMEEDIIHIAKGKGIRSPEDVLDKAKELKNGDVELNLGHGTKIVLRNVSLDDLKANPDDFIEVS